MNENQNNTHCGYVFKALCNFNCSACSVVMSKIIVHDLQSISNIVNPLVQLCQIHSKTTSQRLRTDLRPDLVFLPRPRPSRGALSLGECFTEMAGLCPPLEGLEALLTKGKSQHFPPYP